MRRSIVSSSLTLAFVLAAGPALADTTIGSSTTANVRTSTVNSGAADNVVISSGGTITSSGGTVVTIDSSNTVSNAGTITTTDLSTVIAVGGGGGYTSGITNTNAITIGETYTQTDANSDGIVDGAFSNLSGNYGIRLTGSGAFTGNIANTAGTITIKGNDSAGIASDVAIVGSVSTTGSITVTGDRSTGVRLGNVSGLVAISGATSATGQGATGVALTGDVGGAVVIHSAVTSTGYTSNTLPSDVSTLTAGNLLQGGSAVTIQGNVGGGVLIATTTTSTDTTLDADGDGIADTTQGTGALVTFGSAPALSIGSTSNPITIGLINSRTVGLALDGTVTASGVYAGVSATGVRIGGLGGAVSITGGMTVSGGITATANGATATALAIGSLATVPSLTNSGTITSNTATTAGGDARGIVIESGGSLPTIANSGTINATVSVGTGRGSAILDQSGTLTSVGNTGTISASDLSGTARAIDVAGNTSGFTYTQSQSSATTTTPKLTGAIVTGSGNDTITASAGTITSDAALGGGNNSVGLSGTAAWTGSLTLGSGADAVTLADTSSFTGTIDFGSGADSLTVGSGATFAGRILNTTPNVALTIAGGTARFTTTDAVSLASLSITGTGSHLGVAINPSTGAHTLITVAGATTIGAATTLDVTLSSLNLATTNYTVLTSGTLTGSSNLNLALGNLPYLLTGTVSANDASGAIAVSLRPKTATEMGLRRSEAAASTAVYAAISGNTTLTNLFLSLGDRASTIRRLDQMLPDHAGGVFDILSAGALRMGSGETSTPWADLGDLSLWMQQSQLDGRQKGVDTPGYHDSGWDMAVGGDVGLGGLGRVGLTLGYVFGSVHNGGGGNEVTASLFQGGLYWMGHWGGLQLSADGSFGGILLSSKRSIEAYSTLGGSLLTSKADWNGTMATGTAKAAYELDIGRAYLRPSVTLTYARLHEGAHTENGGGIGYDLSVDARNSDELAAVTVAALGMKFGDKKGDDDALISRFEVEGGRRTIIGGQLGATTARFTGGSDLTLLPESRGDGYVGDVRAIIGSSAFRFVADVGAEQRDGYHVLSGRVGLRGIF